MSGDYVLKTDSVGVVFGAGGILLIVFTWGLHFFDFWFGIFGFFLIFLAYLIGR